jgi:glycosyltransferase involved in cell wall biosynthesis
VKVLHASCFLEYPYGGAEKITRALLELLPSERVASTVVCLAGGSSPCRVGDVHRLPAPASAGSRYAQLYKRYVLFLQNGLQNRRWQKQIQQRINIKEFNLLHCHDLFWLGVMAPLARLYNKPLLFTCHLNLPFRLILAPALKLIESLINVNLARQDWHTRKHLRQAVSIVTPSEFCSQAMRNFLNGNAPPVGVIPNWIDDYLLEEPQSAAVTNARSVVYVGRLCEEKGVGLLLKAAERMKDVEFTFVGSHGPLEERVRRETRVKWIPSVPHPEMVHFLRKYSVAACPSLVDESFGLTALEYRLAGVKVVATRSGAMPEILDTYPNVFWTDQTVESLEKSLAQALARGPVAETKVVHDQFITKFSRAHAVEEYCRLYDSLCYARG